MSCACAQVGVNVTKEGSLDAATIEKDKLIDKHYYAIANKASLSKPHELNPPAAKQEEFAKKFGVTWKQALADGRRATTAATTRQHGATPTLPSPPLPSPRPPLALIPAAGATMPSTDANGSASTAPLWTSSGPAQRRRATSSSSAADSTRVRSPRPPSRTTAGSRAPSSPSTRSSAAERRRRLPTAAEVTRSMSCRDPCTTMDNDVTMRYSMTHRWLLDSRLANAPPLIATREPATREPNRPAPPYCSAASRLPTRRGCPRLTVRVSGPGCITASPGGAAMPVAPAAGTCYPYTDWSAVQPEWSSSDNSSADECRAPCRRKERRQEARLMTIVDPTSCLV